LTLVANSRRLELKRGEVGAPGFRKGHSVGPGVEDAILNKLIAAAVTTCCEWVLDRPRYRMRSSPLQAEWHATLAKAYGEDKATALVATLKKAHPEKSIRILSYMCSGPGVNTLAMRNNVVKMSKLKDEQKAVPVYTYYFTCARTHAMTSEAALFGSVDLILLVRSRHAGAICNSAYSLRRNP
jgi:hypothetical protein